MNTTKKSGFRNKNNSKTSEDRNENATTKTKKVVPPSIPSGRRTSTSAVVHKAQINAFQLQTINICGPATYLSLRQNTEDMVLRLKETFNLKEEMIMCLIAYVKMLPAYRSNFVDEGIFRAFMLKRLKMTDINCIDTMFKQLKKQNKGIIKCLLKKYPSDFELERNIHIKSFVYFLCQLLTEDLGAQAKMVFQINDNHHKGYLIKSDLLFILAQSQPAQSQDDKDEGLDDPLEFLANEVAAQLGMNTPTTRLTCEDFQQRVKRDKLLLDIMGPSIPKRIDVIEFMDDLESLTPFAIQTVFRHERKNLLNMVNTSAGSYIQSLYEVPLEVY